MKYEEYLEFAKDIAIYAGDIMLKYFNQKGIGHYKADKSIVTLADTEINSYLIQRVKETYPTHAVDGEEEKYSPSGSGLHSPETWICDPVDGTAQFARGVPVAVFSLALCIDGIPQVGVVYDPFLKQMWWGVKGQGAFKNSERLQVNELGMDDENVYGYVAHWPRAKFNAMSLATELMKRVYCPGLGSITRGGILVAEGHNIFTLFPSDKPHDLAAVKVIVEEAGGIVRNFYGQEERFDQPLNGVIVSNKVVYNELLAIVKKHLET